MDAKTLERLLQLIALGQQAFIEAEKIINNHRMQSGKSEQQVLDDAQNKNNEAKKLIDAL